MIRTPYESERLALAMRRVFEARSRCGWWFHGYRSCPWVTEWQRAAALLYAPLSPAERLGLVVARNGLVLP